MTPYTTDDEQVIRDELIHIGKKDSERRIGLAFSGGGIRSASFGMGVLQAMVGADVLKKMDYLSTVSGGGYLGSSLTYFLSQLMPNGQPYGTDKRNFPFGSLREGGKVNQANNVLDYIRQHGNYLVPGNRLNALSFVAILLRTILMSFAIYFLFTAGLMMGLLKFIPPEDLMWTCLDITGVLALTWIAVALLFSLFTFPQVPKYGPAVFVQGFQGLLLALMIVFLAVAALPWLHIHMDELVAAVMPGITDSQTATRIGGRDYSTGDGASASTLTMVIGVIFSVLSHLRQMGSSGKGISPVQIVVAAIFLLFTIVYGAFVAAIHLSAQDNADAVMAGMLGISLVFGIFCNVNYVGLARMYRNRLMETFMPDSKTVSTGNWGMATTANKSYVRDMCRPPNNRPYHLINCNIVLVDSNNAKLRGRRGDSFTLSPLYCGSDATGWRKTANYMVNLFRSGITLPTAMATSGAAANPNAGASGRGPTVNKFVSTVMSLLNLRLGFWAINPNRNSTWFTPNYFSPGLKGGLFSAGLNEKDHVIELSDGGHFENLAVYELLRRQVDLIIVSDAGADGNFEFSDLANLLERARVDFGVNIVFEDAYDFTDIIPEQDMPQPEKDSPLFNLSKRAFAVARIEYRKEKAGDPRHIGHLVYIKPTMIRHLSADVVGYKKQEPTFPHQSTLDQFFSERQFEAYRELGYYLGWSMLEDPRVAGLLNAREVEWEKP